MSELDAVCERALARALALTDTDETAHVADRAIGLHCLSAHAPRFFERHRLEPLLQQALERLGAVPSDFPATLPWHEGMARLDALYFRALHGLPRREVSGDLQALVDRVSDDSILVAWLLAELAQALDLDVNGPEPEGLSGAERAYWRTHQVLLWTSYLRDPLPEDTPEEVLAELDQALAMRLVMGDIDPAAEMIFCLTAAGRSIPAAYVDVLAGHQRPDGSFVESVGDDAREQAHTTIVCLVALAGLLEREPQSSGPSR